ncbi:hypothetical protein RHSIM_Rhsim11G0019100 [Rhododendron simsii]|uniref:Single-stranded DNA binding protein Ssb-like OB fold domain-containing protein n=1 Tax=Rhododendron simsii TaxID=118357 RepID=A0A834G907_RHOSS|nr:hypothetical protein RHSIM_Rhsim11G0019100 [Rhododendron simsii]
MTHPSTSLHSNTHYDRRAPTVKPGIKYNLAYQLPPKNTPTSGPPSLLRNLDLQIPTRKMFYSQFKLAKKGTLGMIWIAAHLEQKLRKNQVADTDIGVLLNEPVKILECMLEKYLNCEARLLVTVVDLMKPGATIILRNAKIDMLKGSMRLALDKLNRVEVTEPG